MTPLSDVSVDLGIHAAEVLSDVSDPTDYDTDPDYQPLKSIPVSVLELGGSEAFALGLSVATKLRRVFCDLESGSAPFDTENRLRVRGETLNVLNVRALDIPGEAICISECEVM